ncbi:MAG TPA: class I SAM-dependent methyltransferase [Solirubrobacterales bacterium]|nr:class I SAM-dependent methyltransferase [Solirubrobacterales bacterium]
MGEAGVTEIPQDWYRSAFPPEETLKRPWADRTGVEVDRALAMLGAQGGERVLDMACGTGRHSHELARRGFEVVGTDISPDLLAIAEADAEAESLSASFLAVDLRELDFDQEFDLVLNLNDGAIGYFETEEENHRTFEVIAAALRPGGGNLLQLPNVLYAETHLPQTTWIAGEGMVELIDHRWEPRTRYLEGSTMPILVGEVFEGVSPIPFRQRLYSVDELTEIYDSVGMEFSGVFRGTGKPRPPKDSQFEVFFSGRKPA